MTLEFAAFEELCQRAGASERQQPDAYPAETVRDFLSSDFLAAPFPSRLGGSGWTPRDAARAMESLATVAPSAALIAAMPLGLAGVFGSEWDIPVPHQSDWHTEAERIAHDYQSGLLYAACNSEAGAGGSLAATKTRATLDTGVWRLHGDKILASSGRFADVYLSTAKVSQDDLPGAGVVEFFLVPVHVPEVVIAEDWNGFGMRATESQSVRYKDAPADRLLGFPNFIELVQPVSYWYCLFAAIPLGCAAGLLRIMSTPSPASPALRLRLTEARMRYEALAAYLHETAGDWRPAAGPEYAARVLRMKTYVSSEATKLAAELFALGGGRHYRRDGEAARFLADSFAGTALRPPLALALELLADGTD